MSESTKILVLSDPSVADDAAEVFGAAGAAVKVMPGLNPSGATEAAINLAADVVVMFDEIAGATDGSYIMATRTLERMGKETVFIASEMRRSLPSEFFGRLRDAGCEKILCLGAGESWEEKAGRVLCAPIDEEELERVCAKPAEKPSRATEEDAVEEAGERPEEETEPEAVAKPEPVETPLERPSSSQIAEIDALCASGDIDPQLRDAAAGMSPAAAESIISMGRAAASARQEASMREARKAAVPTGSPLLGVTHFVNVCQANAHEGSTHVSMALARAFSIAGKKTACVLPDYHFRQMRETFSKAKYDPANEALRVNAIDFYAGEIPTDAGDGYDVVVCDFGLAEWLYDQETLTEGVAAEERKRDFYNATVRVMSSFVSPTGRWGARFFVMQGMKIKDFNKTTFAVFGLDDDRLFDLYCEDIRSKKSQEAKITRIGYAPFPVMAAEWDDVDAGVREIACRVLTERDRTRLEPQVEAVAQIAPETKKKGLFGRKGARR